MPITTIHTLMLTLTRAAGDDEHGHDHGWAPWRYMVLAIPVFLFFLGLPREGLTDRSPKHEYAAAEVQTARRCRCSPAVLR